MPLAQATPRPIVPKRIIEDVAKRQFLSSLSNIFDPPTTSNGGASGGAGSNGGSTGGSTNNGGGSGSTNNGSNGAGGGSTNNGGSTSPTSQPDTTSSSPSSTREQVTSITSSRSSTIVQQTTSNGVITQVTVITNAPEVVVSTASVGPETSRPKSSGSSSSNGGLIGGVVGGVVGGLALLTLLILAVIVWRRRRSRTGHGWLLCFGRKPDTKNDLDVDWPTFDPSAGAAGVGGTFGDNRRKSQGYNGGTLPNIDDDGYHGYNGGGMGDYGSYQGDDEMRDMANGYPTSAPSYGGAPTSDGAHYGQQSQQWHMGPMTSFSNGAHSSAPDYSHLDAPEVREERAREQAQAQAMAAAAAAAASPSNGNNRTFSHTSGSPPPTANGPPRFGSPVGSASPPPNDGRPLSGAMNEHRFSQGTAQMLSDNNFFLSSPQLDDDNGTVLNDNSRRTALHLHNPDAQH